MGVRGHYFFWVGKRVFWNLPSEIEAVTAPVKIKRLWLGRDDTFVLVKDSGSIYFDLKGRYHSLSERLGRIKVNGQSIKVSDFYSQHHEHD